MTNSNLTKFIYTLVFLLFGVLTIVISIFAYLVININRSEEKENILEPSSSKMYQYLIYDHSQNEISRGMATGGEQLDEEGIMKFGGEFFFDEDENRGVLISEIGNNEFKCVGRCFCDEGVVVGSTSRNYRTANVISRGLYVLVAAVSSSLAYNYALLTIQKECEKVCEEGSTTTVKSEIEGCEEIDSEYNTVVSSDDDDNDQKTEFLCAGHCLLNSETEKTILDSEDKSSIDRLPKIKEQCEKIEGSGSVKVSKNDEDENMMVSVAKNIFIANILTPDCIMGSRQIKNIPIFEIDNPSPPSKNHPFPTDSSSSSSSEEGIRDFFLRSQDAREMKRHFLVKRPPTCVASENEFLPISSNPSVECRKI